MTSLEKYPLDEWARVINTTAIEKGFWDASDNVETKLMLIICELGEAVEADRKDKKANHPRFLELYLNKCSTVSKMRYEDHGIQFIAKHDQHVYIELFEEFMKDTIEDEIADAFIRMLDLIAHLYSDHSVELAHLFTFIEEASDMEFKEDFAANCLTLSGTIVKSQLEKFIAWTIQYCEHLDIDLKTHVELKMLYNSTRDKLHGKRY